MQPSRPLAPAGPLRHTRGMGQEHDDYAEPGSGPSRPWPRWLPMLLLHLAAAALFGAGIVGAAAFYLVRDHVAR